MKTFKKWRTEIAKVGFVDWFWFVVYLKRNEFHPRLNMNYSGLSSVDEVHGRLVNLTKSRNRAHRIDLELSNIPSK
jgi:hypothetical protein